MHIILFGGAFDPPHVGHLQVVRSILEEELADQVWLVPVGQHPFAKKMSADVDRLAMLELTFTQLDSVEIKTYELEKKGVGYSYQTLQHFSQLYPTDTFSWLIGSDNLASFHQWGFYQELLQEFKVYVYPRKGFQLNPLYPGMTILSEVPEVAISSSEIKEKMTHGLPITDHVVPAVEQYIIENKLYQQ